MALLALRTCATETGLPLNEVRLLAQHLLKLTRAALLIREDQPVTDEQHAEFHALLARRVEGEPIAYITGTQEFYGRPFKVGPAVLIPRPETEELLEKVLASLQQPVPPKKRLRVLDVGTGSGAIAITLALESKVSLEVHACDVSEKALCIAQENAVQLKAEVHFRASDWLLAFETEATFDLIISNPPYIVYGDPHLHQGDLRFEPAVALTDFSDGLSAYRALAQAAMRHLTPDGILWVEHGYHQRETILEIFAAAGLCDCESHQDLAGLDRMICARRPAC
ncbi:MAG: peptide chain release factor N(5)-glutamine methyltransferase [Burkholderiales bacterium]|nr:peptide chain release factor N(5)-glutamine methyltransferase [Burkholderiales bacterium]